MTLPPVTFDLVRRLEDASLPFSVARLEALRDRPETGLEMRIERFGEAVAPAAPGEPELDFVNRIEGLGPTDSERFDEILAFYGSLGIEPWLELAPRPELEQLGAVLGRARPRTVGFHGVLYGLPARPRGGSVDVRRADGAEAESAARLLLEAHGVPEAVLATHGSALAAAVERVDGRLYVTNVDGVPAAAAVLTVADGVGYLASAATLPGFRGRGCQTALIAARTREAAHAGCDLITSGAEFGSASQRNLERAGFRVAYTKPVLRLSPRAASSRAGTA